MMFLFISIIKCSVVRPYSLRICYNRFFEWKSINCGCSVNLTLSTCLTWWRSSTLTMLLLTSLTGVVLTVLHLRRTRCWVELSSCRIFIVTLLSWAIFLTRLLTRSSKIGSWGLWRPSKSWTRIWVWLGVWRRSNRSSMVLLRTRLVLSIRTRGKFSRRNVSCRMSSWGSKVIL